MRALLDTNVTVAGLLAPKGAPGQLLTAWVDGYFEMVTSPLLFGELEQVLAYPKIAKRISEASAQDFCTLVRTQAEFVPDLDVPVPFDVPDPADAFVVQLCLAHRLPLVTGDAGLLSLAGQLGVVTPRTLLEALS